MSTNRQPRLGILGNLTKQKFRELLPEVLGLLRDRAVEFVLDDAVAQELQLKDVEAAPVGKIPDSATLIFSFGGDGTFLRTARIIGRRGIPILGINMGPGLGYLTELLASELPANLDRILKGEYNLESRMLLTAFWDDGEAISALNDIVVRPQQLTRVHSLNVSIDGAPLTTYRGDGLIVSTPTGSTAYSLSASGPIVEPTLQTMLLTPISPHTLSMRPLVVSDRRVVEISPGSECCLIADGEIVKQLRAGSVVRVARADYTTRIINLTGRDFYHTLRSKLHWGSPQPQID